MALPQEEYKYDPLPPQTQDAIRLLTINPAEQDDPLTGHFSVTSLRDSPTYEALSYVWGDSEKPEFLYTPEGYIRITRSLYAALKRVRQYEPPHEENEHFRTAAATPPRCTPATVWADAICINQEDNTEKAHQVRLMGKIFSSANLVWAYLGEYAAFLDDLYVAAREYGGRTWHVVIPNLLRSDSCTLRAIFELDYFSRVWIIQEFSLARKVAFICGSFYVSSSLLQRLVNDLSHGFDNIFIGAALRFIFMLQPRSVANQASTIFQLRSDYIEERQRWPLVKILHHSRRHACTRARDHLFAVLSLADDASDSELDPDYDEPIEETVKRYARVIVKRGYVMELLNLAGHDSEPVGCLRFPSWIPDWMSDFHNATVSVGCINDWRPVKIDRATCSVIGDILQVTGRFVDEILDIQRLGSTGIPDSYTMLVEIENERLVDEIGRWLNDTESSSMSQYAKYAAPLFDEICRTLDIPSGSNCPLMTPPYSPPDFSRLKDPTERHLIHLIWSLPTSAFVEKLRSLIRVQEPKDDLFVWLAELFTQYRTWHAHRVSIGLSRSPDGGPLEKEHYDCQKCTDNSSKFDRYIERLSLYSTNKCFVVWVKKQLNNLPKAERYQFIETLNKSEQMRQYFFHLQKDRMNDLHHFTAVFLHIFRTWRVFRTKSGKIGVGTFRTRIGDRLYITKASKKPIVVRRVEGEEGLYRFVAVAEISSVEFEDYDDQNEVLRVR